MLPTPDDVIAYTAIFFTGAFLCNCIPHLCAGLQGMPFPTPFATPRGHRQLVTLREFPVGCLQLVRWRLFALGKSSNRRTESQVPRVGRRRARAWNLFVASLREGSTAGTLILPPLIEHVRLARFIGGAVAKLDRLKAVVLVKGTGAGVDGEGIERELFGALLLRSAQEQRAEQNSVH